MPILIPTYHLQFMNHAKHTSYSIIYISLTYNHTQPKQTIQESTNIQTQHCLAQRLAQAEGSRSGEFSLRLGEGTRSGAWATRDLA